jgi:hypothetical protein
MSAYTHAITHVVSTLRAAGIQAPVCEGIVANGAAYPVVLVQSYGDAMDTIGTGSFRALTVVDLLIRVVGRSDDAAVPNLADDVDQALHGSAGGAVAGCVRLTEQTLVLMEEGTAWRYQGGRYELTVA